MADKENEPKKKSNFGEGLVNELTGKAKRGDVSAFNLENLIFGTLGHIALGVGGAAIVQAIAKKPSLGKIRGLFGGVKGQFAKAN